MQFELISSKSIISEYIADTDTDESINTAYYQRIISDAISQLCYHEQMEHKVALLEVENHHATLPDNFEYAIQIAYRGIEDCKYTTRMEIAQWVSHKGDCDIEVNVKCDKCSHAMKDCKCETAPLIIDTTDLFRQSPPPYLLANRPGSHVIGGGGLTPFSGNGFPSTLYHEFKLIKPAQHSFHNADYHVGGCLNLDKKLHAYTQVEYTLSKESPRSISINRESGQILIAYFAAPVDCDGFRLIPNRTEYIEAMKWAIEEKFWYKIFRRSKSKDDGAMYRNAQENKKKYFGMCRDIENIPDANQFRTFWRNNMDKNYNNGKSEYNFYRQENDKYYSLFRNKR